MPAMIYVIFACSPYHFGVYVIWYVKWVWRYNIQQEEYSYDDKIYIMKKNLKMTENHWKVRTETAIVVLLCKCCRLPQALPEEKQEELIARELWVDANFKEYKAEQEDEMKTKLASSGKYKMYRSESSVIIISILLFIFSVVEDVT